MKSKSVPNLPTISKMKSPSSGGPKVPSMNKGKNSVTKKIMATAKGKSVKPKY